MKRVSVLTQLILRHTFGVCMAGALLGAIYGLLWVLFGTIAEANSPGSLLAEVSFLNILLGALWLGTVAGGAGGVLGSVLGMAAGLVNGLLLGTLTLLAWYPPAEYRYYRLITGLISAAAAIVTSFAIIFYMIPWLLPNWHTTDLLAEPARLLLTPVPIAGFGAWWVSRFVARWYQHSLPSRPAQQGSPSSPRLL